MLASAVVRPNLNEIVGSKRENKAPAKFAKNARGAPAVICVGLFFTSTIELTTGTLYDATSVRMLDTDLPW